MDIVENANTEILKSPERYLIFLIQETKRTVKDLNIKYQDVKDTRKTYPAFTTKQFALILQVLHERIYKPNTELLRDNIYISRYDISKCELCFKVFNMLCLYYNMNCTIEGFCTFSGIEKTLLLHWLNTGTSKLYLDIKESTRNIDDFEMLNSKNALLRLHYRNHEEIEHIQAQNENILPDLLTSDGSKMSLQDAQAELIPNKEQLAITGKPKKAPKKAEKP